MATTLIFLTALGVVTIFWEPLTALALGSESASEPHAASLDAGEPASATTPPSVDASGPSVDASGNS